MKNTAPVPMTTEREHVLDISLELARAARILRMIGLDESAARLERERVRLHDLKHCACGNVHDAARWAKLPLVGVQPGIEADDFGDAVPPIELRNCPCGSTLAIELPSEEDAAA